MAISKRTRFEVLRRDNYTCRYCRSVENPLTIDHVVPVALGGSGDPTNLVACCKDCNAGKSSATPDTELVADVSTDAQRWSAAMQLAAERLALEREAFKEYGDRFLDAFEHRLNHLPDDWESTIESFYKVGLPVEELVAAAVIATNARYVDSRFAYFCGVAWRRVGKMQELAREILEEEPTNSG